MLNTKKLYNTEGLLNTHQATPEFLQEMVSLFVQHVPQTSAKLKKASEENNWEQVYYFAHKIKASIDLFNLEPIKEVVRRVEQNALKLTQLTLIAEDVDFINNYVQECVFLMKKEFKLE